MSRMMVASFGLLLRARVQLHAGLRILDGPSVTVKVKNLKNHQLHAL